MCQIKGRLRKSLQCSAKNLSRSQSSSDLGAPPFGVGGRKQTALGRGRPLVAVGADQKCAQSVGGTDLAAGGRETDNAVGIGEVVVGGAAVDEGALFGSQTHGGIELGGPAITEEAGDGDL